MRSPRAASATAFPFAAGTSSPSSAAPSGAGEREPAALRAGRAVIALASARLHEIVERRAAIDALTGLANRARCEELLRQELARARRQGAPVAFVFADLDSFKDVND